MSTHRQVGGGSDEFYVGYLPMPRALAGFLVRRLIAVVLLLLALAVWLATAQRDPGPAVWSSASPREFIGQVVARPYPHLRVLTDAAAGGVQTMLLVSTGKFGAADAAAAFDGQTARVSGWLLERDGRRMIELKPESPIRRDVSLSPRDGERLGASQIVLPRRVTLHGEIVDSKCYLGAMKPGEGKTHKECATLCIAGGIPPMFVTVDSAGARTYYLLAGPDGGPLGAEILPFVADAVEVAGDVEVRDDLRILRISADDVRRL